MVREKIGKEEIIRLFFDIFSPVWRKGLEKVVRNIDDKSQIPFPKKYMGLPMGAADLETAPHWKSLIIRDSLAFSKEWPCMEASVNFLLRWQGIIAKANNVVT